MIVRPQSRHTIASLAWGVVFFAAILGAAQLVLPGWLEKYSDPPYTFRRERLIKRLEAASANGKRPPLVVTLGSSRMMDAIDGQAAEQELRQSLGQEVCIANFGAPACGPYHSLTLLGRLLRDDIVPDMVVVEILCSHMGEASVEQLFSPEHVPLTTADRAWLAERGVTAPAGDETAAAHPVALFGLRTNLLKATMPRLLPRHQNTGWFAKADQWGTILMQGDLDENRRAKGLAFAEQSYRPGLSNFRLGETGLNGLRILLDECHRRNIATAVLLTPEGPTFRTWYRPVAREEIEARLLAFAQENNTRLIVSSDWIEEADFADSHHLLAPGANKFSTRLSREGIVPILASRQAIARNPSAGGSPR